LFSCEPDEGEPSTFGFGEEEMRLPRSSSQFGSPLGNFSISSGKFWRSSSGTDGVDGGGAELKAAKAGESDTNISFLDSLRRGSPKCDVIAAMGDEDKNEEALMLKCRTGADRESISIGDEWCGGVSSEPATYSWGPSCVGAGFDSLNPPVKATRLDRAFLIDLDGEI
jgi:hypothetical protein